MALTLPVVNNSVGTWGTILNAALTDIDNRLTGAATGADLAALATRVTTLENAPPPSGGGGGITVINGGALPAATVGAIVLDTATGFLYYGASVGGTATFVPFPGSYLAKLKRVTTQAYANNAFNALIFDAADFDRLGGWSATTNSSRYTAKVAGSYEFTGAISWATNATSVRQVYFSRNGATINGSNNVVQAVTGTPTYTLARATIVNLAVNDYVEMFGSQSSGASLNTDNNNTEVPCMQVKYLGYNV